MKSNFIRRYRRHNTPSKTETSFFKKEGQETFFGEPARDIFFQSPVVTSTPSQTVQRKCEDCEKEDKKVQKMDDKKEEDKKVMRAGDKKEEEKVNRQPDKKEEEKVQKKESGGSAMSANVASNYIGSMNGKGQPLPANANQFFSSRMGYDFSDVKIHHDKEAADSATDIHARAYTVGNNVVFNQGEYDVDSSPGRKLMAHELTHVMQQNESDSGKVQRAVSFNVLDWDATSPGSPAITDTPAFIGIPPTDQVLISGLIEVNGSAADPCNDFEFGTTQTAWMSWMHLYYHGRTAADGSIVIAYRPSMPMRDPGVGGSIWYDNTRVRSPAACGDSAGVFHNDGPWKTPFKTRTNGAVAGGPLNYLTGYTMGLHLVTYLTGKRKGGSYLARPLKYRYWNSIQDLAFTPNYASPASAWGHSGGVKVNIGGQGSGETGDAPYFTTAGTNFNTHFNDNANWTVTERR